MMPGFVLGFLPRRSVRPGEGGMDLTTRIRNILIAPKREWPVIAEEPADAASLYTGYVLPMAAIPPACSAIGLSVVAVIAYRMASRAPPGWAKPPHGASPAPGCAPPSLAAHPR